MTKEDITIVPYSNEEFRVNLYIKETELVIKEATIEKFTITFWWCRFMYYLDYELNKRNS